MARRNGEAAKTDGSKKADPPSVNDGAGWAEARDGVVIEGTEAGQLLNDLDFD